MYINGDVHRVMRKLLVAGTCFLALSACQLNNQTDVALLGGGSGDLLGNTTGSGSGRTAAIVGSTFFGTLAGSQIDANMGRSLVQQSQVAFNRWTVAECARLINPGVQGACERVIGERDRQRAAAGQHGHPVRLAEF